MPKLEIDLNKEGTDLLERSTEATSPSSLFKKVRSFIVNRYSILLVLSIIIGVSSMVGAIYYIIETGKSPVVDIGYKLLGAQMPANTKLQVQIPAPPDVKEFENPLNGQLLTKEEWETMKSRPAVGVIINNHVAARPQSGLDKADVVYESLVESGITRYLAIYWGPDSQVAKEIGPIRSIRQYQVDWAIEYKVPVVMHIGWAGYDEGIDKVIVPAADSRSYILSHPEQLRSLQSSFWRDANRVAPHDAYNSIDNILSVAKNYNWGNEGQREPYKFKSDLASSERPDASSANITFMGTREDAYSVRWVYNKFNNNYERFLAGIADIDKVTGKQLTARNIIFQNTEYQLANDDKGRILLTTVGSGNATFMLDGKVINGTWSKESKTAKTKYYTSEGNEVELNRGKVWIEVIPTRGGTILGKVNIN